MKNMSIPWAQIGVECATDVRAGVSEDVDVWSAIDIADPSARLVDVDARCC